MSPYYERDGITLYHADCRDVLPLLSGIDAVVTDPPYGISYSSGMTGHDGGTALPGIVGDTNTELRDYVIRWHDYQTAIVFGSWKAPRPENCRAVLIWEKGDHVGMGDLSLPWKPNTEEIYVIGDGFIGHRGSSVLKFNAPVSWNSVRFGRIHPHEKPLPLMVELLSKVNGQRILDPFGGSMATGAAAWECSRECILCEIDERYCELGAKRLDSLISQGRLFKPEPVTTTQRSMFEDSQ